MIVSPKQLETLQNDVMAAIDRCVARITRKISQFALEEIVLPPSGPFRDRRFSYEFQPFVRLWFELIESGAFCRYAVVGPTQTGKTLSCLVIPAMFHLFEMNESVIVGIPQMDMAMDKWTRDFLPAIKASRYAELLPDAGTGSKGGKFESITFKNGATLKFMSAQGGDEKRSGFTSRILLMTEVDKYDAASETSREADPVTQMIARLDAFAVEDSIIYMECSPSIEEGRIWTEYINGSEARIALSCPHCDHFVTLEREHLIGWSDATSEVEAREGACFACPQCGHEWTEEERAEANRNAVLVHKGQSVTPDGKIHGPLPKTLTAGFRWNVANSLFKPAADIGGVEWKARFAPDEENSDKGVCQFYWAKPAKATITDQTPLDVSTLLDRMHPDGRGIVPATCELVTVGCDLGGHLCHWTAMAWDAFGRGFIIDQGRIVVPQATLGLEVGLMEAMRELREMCGRGWLRSGDGAPIIPDEVLIDSGWKTPIVYDFIRETGGNFRPCKGLSVSGEAVEYNRPKSTGAIVRWIGDGWHIARLKDDAIDLVEIDADEAKSTLHARLSSMSSAPGAITLFHVDRSDMQEVEWRRRFVRQLTAEKSTQEFVKRRGMVTRWTKIRQDNHWLDSTALALVAASISGVSVAEADPRSVSVPRDEPAAPVATPVSTPVAVVRAPAPVRPVAHISQEMSRDAAVRESSVRTVRSGWIRRSS